MEPEFEGGFGLRAVCHHIPTAPPLLPARLLPLNNRERSQQAGLCGGGRQESGAPSKKE